MEGNKLFTFSKSSIAKIAIATSASAALIVSLSACASSSPAEVTPTAKDVWIKAVPELMDGMAMTGMFGEFCNDGDTSINILGGVAADTALTKTKLDAHEVVKNDAGEMVMQEVEGGIPIPAHGCVTLKPGSYHVMFWDLEKPIAVGDDVKATINFSNGTTLDVTAVAREIQNANENYKGDSSATPSATMDMN